MSLFRKNKESEIVRVYRETYLEKTTISSEVTVAPQASELPFDFIVIDFETANNNLNSACSIGIVAVKGTEIIHREQHLIHPPTAEFDPINISIHGITYDDVANCEKFPGIWNRISKYFDNSIVVAHNAQFDMSVLKNCLDTYSIELPNFIYLDSQTISRFAIDRSCGNSLRDRADYFNVLIDNHHNALADAIAAAEICICTLNSLKLPSLTWMGFLNDLSTKGFRDIKANKTFKNGSKKQYPSHGKIKISEIVSFSDDVDDSNPFFGKKCVFTGELQNYDRRTAMQIIADAGGIVRSSVSRATDYLIVGAQDNALVGDDGLSSKEEKAYELIEAGIQIEIITEDEFLSLVERI